MADDLCLLQIHAHPDDEASKGAGTSAKYAAEGIRNVLVCCTGGEEGDILNPAMDRPDVRAHLGAVRMAELDASARAIGYESVQMLGYRDSGMPETEANARADNFANAPLDEAVARFVKIIRAERPQVIITYHEDRNWYPHPDHLRVWEISGPAFDAAGDPDQFPDAGEPWQPSKLYYVAWSMARVKALHAVYIDRGQESPFARWFEGENPMPDRDERFTSRIDVSEHLGARRAALLAHATQVDPEGHWMAIPDELVREVYPWEDYILARTLIPGTVPEGGVEDDLFAGLREPARRAR